jgi:hypothetical protein
VLPLTGQMSLRERANLRVAAHGQDALVDHHCANLAGMIRTEVSDHRRLNR